VQEIAEVVQVGTATVSRDLAMARAWLRGQLGGQPEEA
jgi:DNA-directed RNA polymerase specialized sigma24 family protein